MELLHNFPLKFPVGNKISNIFSFSNSEMKNFFSSLFSVSSRAFFQMKINTFNLITRRKIKIKYFILEWLSGLVCSRQSSAGRKRNFEPVFFCLFFLGRREFMSLKIVAISIMNGNGKSSCELPFKVLRFVAFIYYHCEFCFLLLSFNFPHLIAMRQWREWRNTKNKHGKVKMKRLRNVEKLLFTFLLSPAVV